jgi:AcrR family transcriptional regulator
MAVERRLTTSAWILEAAAGVLAEREASMGEIAEAAGVGRATLYRHYPTRDALLRALAEQALDEIAARLDDARLDRVAVPEALERAARALLAVGDRYVVVVRERVKAAPGEAERRIGGRLAAVFERGAAEGVVRDDLSPRTHARLFGSLVGGGLQAGLQRELGIEEAAAALTSVYLDGARVRTA